MKKTAAIAVIFPATVAGMLLLTINTEPVVVAQQAEPLIAEQQDPIRIPFPLPPPKYRDTYPESINTAISDVYAVYFQLLSQDLPDDNADINVFDFTCAIRDSDAIGWEMQRWAIAYASQVLKYGAITSRQREAIESSLVATMLLDEYGDARFLAWKVAKEAEEHWSGRSLGFYFAGSYVESDTQDD